MADEPKPEEAEDEVPPASGLRTFERWLAGVIGGAGVVVGGVGVFASDNQAGTTAILLLGAVFLLMGVQGTAITSAGKDKVELERRRAGRKTLDKAIENVEEDKPEAAAELVRAAKAIDPSLRRDPDVRALSRRIYELEVWDALDRAARMLEREKLFGGISSMTIQHSAIIQGFEIDALAYQSINPDNRVAIEIKKTTKESINLYVLDLLAQRFAHLGIPVLVVANRPLRDPEVLALARHRSPGAMLEFVCWRDEGDDVLLVLALRRMFTTSGA